MDFRKISQMEEKEMKKRISAFLLVMLMFLLTAMTPMGDLIYVYAAGGPVLKLHYNRPDGDYAPWDVWLWEDGHDGAAYEFAEENGEMVATMNVTPGITKVGFIVRTKDWAKDVGEDQFIDIAEVVSGTVHIYVESQVPGYTKEYGEDAVLGLKLKSAIYDGENTIVITMTGAIEGELTDVFAVSGKAGAVEVSSVADNGDNTYSVTVAEKLNNANHYSIDFDGNTYEVNMPIVYSTEEFETAYTYEGKDLGATWSKDKTVFRVWAPTAESVEVCLYESGYPNLSDQLERIPMTSDVNGTWVAEKSGDLNGTYYTYRVTIDGTSTEACDPYARTTGVNGKRAMVIDLDSTDPKGWEQDTNPHAGERITDAVIYEGHIRDLTVSENSGVTNKGKYLGLAETGTKTPEGIATGLDHMKELGVTHLHILPMYDFGSVDENMKFGNIYNWGYDPVNYNVPEGSYATDPYNGAVRVAEVKQMVQTLHQNGISVVMDVVYNHVYNASEFCFNKIVPGYFSRIREDGSYSNGSGCGNDTASERSMVRKYIVESVLYWAEEYHIDGFRFDLVGLLDTETINEIVETVHAVKPDVIFYGEGWSMDTAVTKDVIMATQFSSKRTPDFAYFNDTIRDALKGSVFDSKAVGFVSGGIDKESAIERCFIGHDAWCPSPSQTINYASCHDNNTLFDRLQYSREDASRADQIRMNNLAAAIVMTSEGVPFLQAGEELLRSKVNEDGTFNENSYNAGDAVNAIDWSCLSSDEYASVFAYYKGLIAFRKEHPVLRLATAEEVESHVNKIPELGKGLVGFEINGDVEGEAADAMYVFFNGNADAASVTIPEGKWNVYISADAAGTEIQKTLSGGEITVDPISALVLVSESSGSAKTGLSTAKKIGVGVAAVAVAAAGAAGVILSRKKKPNK